MTRTAMPGVCCSDARASFSARGRTTKLHRPSGRILGSQESPNPEGRCNFVVLPRAEKEALASEQHTPGIAVLVIPLELEHHPVGMLGHGHGLQPLHK